MQATTATLYPLTAAVRTNYYRTRANAPSTYARDHGTFTKGKLPGAVADHVIRGGCVDEHGTLKSLFAIARDIGCSYTNLCRVLRERWPTLYGMLDRINRQRRDRQKRRVAAFIAWVDAGKHLLPDGRIKSMASIARHWRVAHYSIHCRLIAHRPDVYEAYRRQLAADRMSAQ